MRNAVLAMLVCLCLGACSSVPLSLPSTPKDAEEAADSRKPTKPRDARTRAKLHTELGALYLQANQLAVALEELTIAIDIDPSYAKAYSTRGLAGFQVGEIPFADQDFRRALNLDANDPEINNNYGWFLCQIGREKEGIAFLQKAIKNPLYETPDKAYLNAGLCYAKLSDLAAADNYVQHSLRIAPGNPQALLQLASINFQRGHLELARQQLADLLRRTEPSAEALWLGVRIERGLGNRPAEARYGNQLRNRFPLSREAQELLRGNVE
jgi:type IV pilus assembly protein PilF